MGLLGVILEYAMDSMFMGVIFTLVGVGLLFFLIKGFYPKYTFSPISIIAGVVLFFMLSFHSILFCGAIKLKGMGDEVGNYLYVQASKFDDMYRFSTEESQYFCDLLREEYPLFASYIGSADFRGHTPSTLVEAWVDEMDSLLNAYMLRRIAWGLGFVVLGTFIVVKTMQISQNVTRKIVRNNQVTPTRSNYRRRGLR